MKEIINYLIFGVGTTIINILTFGLLNYTGIDFRICNLIAWVISVLFAFYTNKKYVFHSNNDTKKEEIYFFISRIISLGIEMVLLMLLIDIFIINNLIAKIITNILIVIINYLLSKFVIFKK